MSLSPKLTDNAVFTLKARYLQDDETPEERFRAVARAVAAGSDSREALSHEERFYDLMANLDFLPNTPCLANAGRRLGQLNACFVLPIADSLTTPAGDGILDVARWTGLIHQTGGGTGFDFSRLRPKGSKVSTSNGVASGPVSFIQLIDAVTSAIKQGGIRRGANMAILRVDHPDIKDFIAAKTQESNLTNFNISVAVTNAFMARVRGKEPESSALWNQLAHSAWVYGDPGVVFIDEMNRDNPLAPHRLIEATNPCGEVPLLPWEACTLGSINLGNFYDKEFQVDWQRLAGAVTTAILFLDNVVTVNKSPVPHIDKMTRQTRRLGLGVMGWADLLNKLEIPYDSEAAIELADKLAAFIRKWADNQSRALGYTRGCYPLSPDKKYRNIARLSIAPTGSISTIAGCSAGIEPYFARQAVRKVAIGELVEAYPNADKSHFRTAMEIDPVWHVRHQAAWQKHVDNAVSKTINLPNKATWQEVRHIYELAYQLGCKGITIYRDGSRDVQVYNELCPECGTEMVFMEGCKTCPKCGGGACSV